MTTHQLAEVLLQKSEQPVQFLNTITGELIRIKTIRYNKSGYEIFLCNE